MFGKKRRGKQYSKNAVPLNLIEYPDGYITTLRPEGSLDGTKIHLEKRKLVRPEINYWKTTINVLIPAIICIVVCWWNMLYGLGGFCLYSLIRLREIIIWFIRIYQRYASEDMRLSCVFEPSCSEYMILSIQKHGVIHGGIKGVKRLKRCHFPNGGEDYP